MKENKLKEIKRQFFLEITSEFVLPMITFVLGLLKLTNVISISWLWVFSPLWLPFAISLALGILLLVLMCLYFLFK